MGEIKSLTEEHYRIGFRTGIAIASAIWALLLLIVCYIAYSEINATLDLAENLLNKCYERGY